MRRSRSVGGCRGVGGGASVGGRGRRRGGVQRLRTRAVGGARSLQGGGIACVAVTANVGKGVHSRSEGGDWSTHRIGIGGGSHPVSEPIVSGGCQPFDDHPVQGKPVGVVNRSAQVCDCGAGGRGCRACISICRQLGRAGSGIPPPSCRSSNSARRRLQLQVHPCAAVCSRPAAPRADESAIALRKRQRGALCCRNRRVGYGVEIRSRRVGIGISYRCETKLRSTKITRPTQSIARLVGSWTSTTCFRRHLRQGQCNSLYVGFKSCDQKSGCIRGAG